jgi:hypothetical protein
MTLNSTQLVGNWGTQGVQDGWSSNPTGPSGAWKGTLVLRANMTSTMVFTSGNIAPTRNGDWSLSGTTVSIMDTFGTVWTANVGNPSNPGSMSGSYQSGPQGAAGGNWSAQKL